MQGGSGGGQGQQNESDQTMWMGIGIAVFACVIFFVFHSQILTVLLWIKYIELKLISLFIVDQNYAGLANWVNHANPNRVSLDTLKLLSMEVGNTIKYPCIFICFLFLAFLWYQHPDSGFRDIENMNTLSNKVRKSFPAINIVHGFDLTKTPVDEGPWAMGMTPIEFAKHHQLIHRDPNTEKIIMDQFKAKLLFTEQLGALWQGTAALAPHEKALFAIFAAFINYKREEAEGKLEEIARSITPALLKSKKINFPIHGLLKKYAESKSVLAITERHAYIGTIFVEMLTQARSSGIVLNSLYLWVKPIDRTLWYTLNNVGRKAVFTEASGIQAHWLAEKRLGFPIRQPMIDEAVNALDEAIQSRIIRDL